MIKTKYILLLFVTILSLHLSSCKKDQELSSIFNPGNRYIGGILKFQGTNRPSPFYIIFGANNTAYFGTHITLHTTSYTYINNKLLIPYIGNIVLEFDMNHINSNGAVAAFKSNYPENLSLLSAFAEPVPDTDLIADNTYAGKIEPSWNNYELHFYRTFDYYSYSISSNPNTMPDPLLGGGYSFDVLYNIAFKNRPPASGYFQFGVYFNNSLHFIEYKIPNDIIRYATLKQKT